MTTRLLTLRDVMRITALSRSAIYAMMAESRFPKPNPHRQPGGPVGRAGSARLHRQPAPRRLRAARRVAGMYGDLDVPLHDARPEGVNLPTRAERPRPVNTTHPRSMKPVRPPATEPDNDDVRNQDHRDT